MTQSLRLLNAGAARMVQVAVLMATIPANPAVHSAPYIVWPSGDSPKVSRTAPGDCGTLLCRACFRPGVGLAAHNADQPPAFAAIACFDPSAAEEGLAG